MKRLIVFVLALVLLAPTAAAAPSVSAQSAVLITTDGNRIIYSKNEHKKMGIASTTKIMTSILALEYGTPDTEIVTTPEMVKVEGTSMGLLAGDSVSLEELVYGMLLQSGNDAANTVAYYIGGSVEGFAELMNKKAYAIGMRDSHFVNPTGLWNEEHYSTAYDMAILGSYALSNPDFIGICSSKSARLEYGNPPYSRTLYNHNKLLSSYDGAIGVKTGFTKRCGRCLVSAATRDGITLVCVTLNDPADWSDHRMLLDYGFSVCSKVPLDADFSGYTVPVVGGIVPAVTVVPFEAPSYTSIEGASDEIQRVVYLDKFLYAPVSLGDTIGRADYYLGDVLVESVDLTAGFGVEASAVSEKENSGFFKKIIDFIKDKFNDR